MAIAPASFRSNGRPIARLRHRITLRRHDDVDCIKAVLSPGRHDIGVLAWYQLSSLAAKYSKRPMIARRVSMLYGFAAPPGRAATGVVDEGDAG